MTAKEHLVCLHRLERLGQGLTALCVVPLLLSLLYAKSQAIEEAWMWFGVFLILYAIDRYLLHRARAHLECVGEQFKELYPR